MNARRVDSEREVAISNPTNSWPARNLLPTEVSVDFSDFSSNFKSHNNALALAGLNFDRLSQRRRWDNNDRRSARLRGGSVSPRQPGFPRNTDCDTFDFKFCIFFCIFRGIQLSEETDTFFGNIFLYFSGSASQHNWKWCTETMVQR